MSRLHRRAVPGSNVRMLEKAPRVGADVGVADHAASLQSHSTSIGGARSKDAAAHGKDAVSLDGDQPVPLRARTATG